MVCCLDVRYASLSLQRNFSLFSYCARNDATALNIMMPIGDVYRGDSRVRTLVNTAQPHVMVKWLYISFVHICRDISGVNCDIVCILFYDYLFLPSLHISLSVLSMDLLSLHKMAEIPISPWQ